MAQSLLFFILMSCCSFSVSQNYMYHFINEAKSWTEAQDHCRTQYTDLATVTTMKDLKNLTQTRGEGGSDAWIGLNMTTSDRIWRWSDPEKIYDKHDNNWNGDEPNDNGGSKNCVYIDKHKRWHDDKCETLRCFICYKVPNTDSPVINETKANWITAQHYCRENQGHLISDKSALDQIDTHTTMVTFYGDDKQYWIGLFRDTWTWSDGSSSSFRNWSRYDAIMNNDYTHDKKDCVKLGAQGEFIRDNCTKTNPFICYGDLFILVNLNKTFEEALVYCRRNHRDLAWFIDQPGLKEMAQEKAQMADTEVVWVGLFYVCFLESWIWVNGDYVDSDWNWQDPGENDCNLAGAMEREGQNQWVKRHLGADITSSVRARLMYMSFPVF
ncbi:hypothetical protein WMY93_014769 [Mugilogobius chulae]|uniref:C-type lectin domain-containing protein n=1 Tax=Mugilogobius chulae TaxID=88201 RepID=A0AAW0P7J3_9GOBI